MRRAPSLYLAALLCAGSACTQAATNPISVSDAWVALGPPGATTLNAFMTLHNRSNENVAVVRATTRAAERVELHRKALRGQVLGTEPRGKLVLPAGLDVRLQSNGLHFTLVHPRRELQVGDAVHIDLQLDNGAQLNVSAEVRRR